MLSEGALLFCMSGDTQLDNETKIVLEKIIESVDRLTEETAELVDKYHRRFELGKDPTSQQLAVDRANALTSAAQGMRQAASTLLGIPDRQGHRED